uniref:Max dimerization protein 3 n=1 Tax=Nothoprocta perdicaria TaxID=30464 RepID=A0A8C6Z1I6_NOTPE
MELEDSIQVLLQAAEFLERRERRAEHGYASLGRAAAAAGGDRPCPDLPWALSCRSVHNALEKHRYRALRHCLEQLKQQVPGGAERARSTTLSLLHRARLHIQVSLARWTGRPWAAVRHSPAHSPLLPRRGCRSRS